jgi:hypothetical protein
MAKRKKKKTKIFLFFIEKNNTPRKNPIVFSHHFLQKSLTPQKKPSIETAQGAGNRTIFPKFHEKNKPLPEATPVLPHYYPKKIFGVAKFFRDRERETQGRPRKNPNSVFILTFRKKSASKQHKKPSVAARPGTSCMGSIPLGYGGRRIARKITTFLEKIALVDHLPLTSPAAGRAQVHRTYSLGKYVKKCKNFLFFEEKW